MKTPPLPGPQGVLLVDKPLGPTSHDVVGRVRRLFDTRRVGHAGTLNPLASGVLVVLVGEATKLEPYLTAHAKRYEARVVFGLATDTLDREGAPTATAEPPGWLRDELAHLAHPGARPRLEAALAAERARTAQIPPAYSAIKVDGQRSYARARAGVEVTLPARPTTVHTLTVVGADPLADRPSVDLDLHVAKGYYVRALARDLGEQLGVPAHLGALRRTASGPFRIARTVALDQATVADLLPLSVAAAEALPVGRLGETGIFRARRGQRLQEADFVELSPLDQDAAWLDEAGRLVAIGARQPDEFVLHRVFVEGPELPPPA